MSGDWSRAQESYEAFQATIIPVAQTDPGSTHYRAIVANSHERLAEIALTFGDATLAAERYRQAVILAERSWAEDPEQVVWQTNRARVLAGLGGALVDAGQFREAGLHLDAALRIYASLGETEVEDATVREGHARALHARCRPIVIVSSLGVRIDPWRKAGLAFSKWVCIAGGSCM